MLITYSKRHVFLDKALIYMPTVLFPAASRKEAYFTCNLSSVGVCLNFCGYFDLTLSCDNTDRQDIVFSHLYIYKIGSELI